MGYNYKGSVGVGGVLSELGLVGKSIKTEELITRLCIRFEVDDEEAYEAILDAQHVGCVLIRDGMVRL